VGSPFNARYASFLMDTLRGPASKNFLHNLEIMMTSLRVRFGCGFRVAFLASSLGLAFGVGSSLEAQTAHYAGQQTVVKSGVAAQSVAVDPNGNVYFASPTATKVMKATPSSAGSNTYTTTTVANSSTLFSPVALATDKGGNVYVLNGDAYHNSAALVKLKPGTTYTLSTLLNPIPSAGLTVDSNYDIYLDDQTHHRVTENWYANGNYNTQTILGPGWLQPQGLAVDSSGDVFVGATDQPAVVQEVEKNCVAIQCEPKVAAGWQFPQSVAVDPSKNVYVADPVLGGVFESLSPNYTSRVGVGYGLSSPGGVAVDTSGDVFIADSGNSRVLKVHVGQVNFGSVYQGSTSAPQTMTFVFDTAGTLGGVVVSTYLSSPPTSPLGQDYKNTGAGSCKAGQAYAQGATCTIVATCTPQNLAFYLGEAGIENAGGAVIASATLTCTGTLFSAYATTQGPVTCTTYDSCGDVVSYAPGTIAIYNQPVGIAGKNSPNSNVAGECIVGSAHPPAQTLCTDGPLLPVKKDDAVRKKTAEGALKETEVEISEVSATSVRISWKTAEPARSGVMYQAGKGEMGLTPKEEKASDAPSFVLEKLEPGKEYQVTVWSASESGKEFHESVTLRTPEK
jgi:streptogramin lyase